MNHMPGDAVLEWAAAAVATGARVAAVTGLRDGSSPWRLCLDHEGGRTDVILRAVVPNRIGLDLVRTNAAALDVAAEHGLNAPRLIASDLQGQAAEMPVTLETAVPGTSTSPPTVSVERLRAAGAAIARVHAIPLRPRPALPYRFRPTQVDDHAQERRWATLYRATPADKRPAVVEALRELTAWPAGRARRTMERTHSTPLLQLADDMVREIPRPRGETVFVHGDIWAGNMMWNDDRSVTLVDWKTAGAGDPGVDLGQLRMKMAVQYGPAAAPHVLDGWEAESGRRATNVAYWDAVAALNTPADLSDWEPGFDGRGNRLDAAAVTGRRDAFLRAALDRLMGADRAA